MKRLLAFTILIISLNSCNVITGNGNIRSEIRNTPDFSGINAQGSMNVEIRRGSATSVKVEDDENLLPYLETDVEGGVLRVSYKSGTFINNDHAKVYITVPTLDKVIMSGSSDLMIRDTLSSPSKIEMGVSGSGSIKGMVDAPLIDISVSGSGSIDLSGRTKELDAEISGSGNLHCSDLLSENTKVHVSGSGNAHVFASVSLEASVSGSGDVFYLGDPASPKISTSGSGSVRAGK